MIFFFGVVLIYLDRRCAVSSVERLDLKTLGWGLRNGVWEARLV
jgi:hypothetical protein